jgi:hypothetical protein
LIRIEPSFLLSALQRVPLTLKRQIIRAQPKIAAVSQVDLEIPD